jgi:glutathionylspermidine synthase
LDREGGAVVKQEMDYATRREELYGPLRRIFSWDHMYDKEYALASLYQINQSFRDEIALATESLSRIFAKTISIIQQGSDSLMVDLGIPKEALKTVRARISDKEIPTVVGRFDFALTANGLKMLEFNSDTPTGIVEAFYVNQRVCDYFGVNNPNAGMEKHIEQAFQAIVSRYQDLGYQTQHVYFSALDWHEEDAGTTRYLLEQSGLEARFVPLADLRACDDGLKASENGKLFPVDVLFRLHGLEKLAEDQDVDGYPTGVHVLNLAARKQLALINPPAAFLAQSKALQALIWNLHEAGEFFSDEEHLVIKNYMLPTYLENRFKGRSPYVTKPVFGREGGGVTLFTADGIELAKDKEPLYWEQPMIYQQMVELEQIEIETLSGLYQGRLIWGSFVIGGRASAILARAGGPITGNLAFYLPVGFKMDTNRKGGEQNERSVGQYS